MLERIIYYFSAYPTVRYATVALVLISVSAALLGVTLVLRRFSMIGDGLSHVTFGAASVATVMGLTTPIYVSLPITVLAAVLLLKIPKSSRVGGDAAVACVSAGSLAFGYLILSLFPTPEGFASDACANLFGQGILSISRLDVILCIILGAVLLAFFILFYNRIFAVTFDPDFACATGTRVSLYNTLIAIITGVVTVVAMELVGALLIAALIIFPALSAMRIFKSFRAVAIAGAVMSVICSVLGIFISLLMSTPVGSTVVCVDVVAFALCYVVGRVRSGF